MHPGLSSLGDAVLLVYQRLDAAVGKFLELFRGHNGDGGVMTTEAGPVFPIG